MAGGQHDHRGEVRLAPLVALARGELRHRWRALLLLGLLAGLIGTTVVGAAALARRTTTAYDRLGTATGIDDARGTLIRHLDLLDEIVGLPMVTDHWTGRLAVGQIEGTHAFLGIIAGPEDPSPLLRPVVLDGRLPAAAGPGVMEIAVREDFERETGLGVGTELPLTFLTEADYFRFDEGFEGGHPHGPELTARIVGTFRVAGGTTSTPPGLAAPDALRAHGDAFLGAQWFVRLAGGRADVDELAAAVEELTAGRELPPEGEEFAVADVASTASATATVDNTALLLGRALLALAAAAGAAGGLALVQVYARHHAARADEQTIEVALGATRMQRVGARALAASLPAAIGGLLTAAGAVAAARLEPIGAIRHYEPDPGLHVNVTVVAVGAAATALAVLVVGVATGELVRRRRSQRPLRESSLVERASRVGSPEATVGLRFALEPGRGPAAVPVRSAITGAIVGVAGVVAGLVFAGSLDRLVGSPSRAGVPFDALVVDVRRDHLPAVLDEELTASATLFRSAPMSIGGVEVLGHALEELRGELHLDIESGRLPETPDEVLLGLRAADELATDIGDTVTVEERGGGRRSLAVVGTAVVPRLSGEQFGLNAVVTPEGLERSGLAAPFTGAAVTARPGVDPGRLVDHLAERMEVDAPVIPTEVDNLRQLGRLPLAVAALVGSIAVVALVHAVAAAVRRRRRDLAVLRAMGFDGRQASVAVVVMSLTIVAIGVLAGVPLGVAFGSALWRATAEGAFVVGDASIRWWALTAVAVAAIAIALLASALPARRAARLAPAVALRTE